jgi:hypothetical protein
MMYGRRLRLRHNGGNTQLTIPRDVARHFGLEPRMEFDVLWGEDKIIIDLSTAEKSKLKVQYPATGLSIPADAADSEAA